MSAAVKRRWKETGHGSWLPQSFSSRNATVGHPNAMLLKKLNWRDDWGRLLGLVAIGLGSLNLIRGGVPPELAIGIPVALLLVGLPGMYYMLRERPCRGTREVPCGRR